MGMGARLAIPEAVFAANLDFVNSEIRIPDGWSVLAKEDPSIPSGSIRIAINAGLVVINSTATTIIDPTGRGTQWRTVTSATW